MRRQRGGMVTQRIANPCIPVRFWALPPKNLLFTCTFFYKIFEFNSDNVLPIYLRLKAQTEGFKKKDSFLNFFYFYFSYRQSDISL